MTKLVPTVADEAPAYSSNDSHVHYSADAKARHERLGLALKPGETFEVDAPGPQHLCKQCSPNGEIAPPERPSNRTYDTSLQRAEENEKEELKRRVADLEELVRSQGRAKTAPPAKGGS
jgi:hypothetical protein